MIAKLMHELTLEKSLGNVIFSFRFAALYGLTTKLQKNHLHV